MERNGDGVMKRCHHVYAMNYGPNTATCNACQMAWVRTGGGYRVMKWGRR